MAPEYFFRDADSHAAAPGVRPAGRYTAPTRGVINEAYGAQAFRDQDPPIGQQSICTTRGPLALGQRVGVARRSRDLGPWLKRAPRLRTAQTWFAAQLCCAAPGPSLRMASSLLTLQSVKPIFSIVLGRARSTICVSQSILTTSASRNAPFHLFCHPLVWRSSSFLRRHGLHGGPADP